MKILGLLVGAFFVCGAHGLTVESQKTLSELKSFMTSVAALPKGEDFSVQRRELADKLLIDLSGPAEEVTSVVDVCVASQFDGSLVPIRLYADKVDPRKIMLFIHGGGNVHGNLDTHDYLCRKIAKIFNMVIVSVDYRLAPEHRFPTPLQDVFSVYTYLSSEYKDVIVVGDGTGGNLAAALCVEAREKEINKPSALMLMYPLLSNEFGDLCRQFENAALSSQDVKDIIESYSGLPYESEGVSRNKLIFPALEGDMSVFPRTCLISAGEDVLLEQQNLFKSELERAGIDNSQITVGGAIHGFMTYGKYFDEKITEVLTACREWLSSRP